MPGYRGARRVAPETRSTHRSVTSWRGRLLILYGGRSEHRRRLVDIYSSRLAYEASVVLPFEASYISVAGDTLFALGELEDEPILAAYLLRPR